MISFYFDYFSNFKKARRTAKNEENPRKSRVFGAISFLVALIGCGDGIFHCPVENIVASGAALPDAPYFLPSRPRCFRHRRRSGSKPMTSCGGHDKINLDKKRTDTHSGVCSFLVAGMGFEPHDLRVMS